MSDEDINSNGNKGMTFCTDNLDYTYNGFMQTLRDIKRGICIIDREYVRTTKVDASYVGLALDLKDALGYSVFDITYSALKNGIRRIEYYRHSDDDIEIYKMAKSVNLMIAGYTKGKLVFHGNDSFKYRYANELLSNVAGSYNVYVNSNISLDGKRSSMRYVDDDMVSGFYSYFRHIGVSKYKMTHIALMAGFSSDYGNDEDWKKVKYYIPDEYNESAIVFCDSVYDAYSKLISDDVFKDDYKKVCKIK